MRVSKSGYDQYYKQPNKKEVALAVAFGKILKSHLEDIGTLEDMQSVYVIPECAINRIVPELLREVQIRVYINITK